MVYGAHIPTYATASVASRGGGGEREIPSSSYSHDREGEEKTEIVMLNLRYFLLFSHAFWSEKVFNHEAVLLARAQKYLFVSFLPFALFAVVVVVSLFVFLRRLLLHSLLSLVSVGNFHDEMEKPELSRLTTFRVYLGHHKRRVVV